MFDIENENPAFVGVLLKDKVVFNVIEFDTEFNQTGRSIIEYLKFDNNGFVSNIIQSQSYNSIKSIFDDKMIFSEYSSSENRNIEDYSNISFFMENEDYDTFYIYDYFNDLLLIKLPELELLALDYRNSEDVRNFIKEIK